MQNVRVSFILLFIILFLNVVVVIDELVTWQILIINIKYVIHQIIHKYIYLEIHPFIYPTGL